jgi:hypothetical protein
MSRTDPSDSAMQNLRPEWEIQRITRVTPHADGQRIVVEADAMVREERTQLEIAVTTDLAPAMALALLATTALARAHRDELEPALEALAAAVVRSSSEDRVRLQLLFDKGTVLPLELDAAAARALSDGLVDYLNNSSKRRYAARKITATP